MPYPSTTYTAQMTDVAAKAEADQFSSLLKGFLSEEHHDDGTHSNVTADTVTSAGNLFEQGRVDGVGVWLDYTPVLSSGGLIGNGTLEGRVMYIGDTFFYEVRMVIGSSTALDGSAIRLSLPVIKRSDGWLNLNVGQWYALDVSASGQYLGQSFTSFNTLSVTPVVTGASQAVTSTLTSTVPFTWATGDILMVAGYGEIA